MCCFQNDHDKSHNIVGINDKKSLENNGISYIFSLSEFDGVFKKAKNLKQLIEDEIEKLNIFYQKEKDDITTTFKNKHFSLDEQEKKLILGLDQKVNEIKCELERFLKDSNNILLSCQKIFNATENCGIMNDVPEIKALIYISEINKITTEVKNFLKMPIRNIDKSTNLFGGDSNNSYKYYYFSGIPIPKLASIVKCDKKISISWNMEELRINGQIKYSVVINIDGKEFKYETSDTKYCLKKYDQKAVYEVKIRAFIDDLYGDWSELQTFKINEFNELTNCINFGWKC